MSKGHRLEMRLSEDDSYVKLDGVKLTCQSVVIDADYQCVNTATLKIILSDLICDMQDVATKVEVK